MMMDIVSTLLSNKLIIGCIIFMISYVSGIAPKYIINGNEHYFSIGNMISAGVLLSGGLVQ